MEKKKYPIGPEHYTLYEEVGQGVSASVHRALCKPLNEIVAIKILDFERDNSDLNSISREAQTMILVDHPNVLNSHCSFVSHHNLWVVMPFMAGGSCLHILKAAYPDGFEEVVIATILREVLKGLEYLHHHGHIHRDVKAGNILIDARGAIKLGDFGVSACLFDAGDRQRMRNTFVGTPCWMAPEVMEQLHGYNFKADIWSFGITALELAHGHAPFSKYPPMKVLMMTLQNAPPGLDYERDRKFSKSFKQMIASCLVKDPSKRPTAKKLLKHSFFRQARSNDYIARTLLEGLPALGDRMKALKRKEEDMLAQKKMLDGEKEELSQNEYNRGISGWNFNLDDVKAQASLIQDVDDPISDNNQEGSSDSLSALDVQEKQTQCQSISEVAGMEEHDIMQKQPVPLPLVELTAGNSGLRYQSENITNCNVAAIPQEVYEEVTEVPPRASKSSATNGEKQDEKEKAPVVQQKGRFKVTSGNVNLEKVVPSPILQKSHSMQVITMHSSISLPSTPPTPLPSPLHSPSVVASSSSLSGYSLFPVLHSFLQTNIVERENILSMMKQAATSDPPVGGCTAAHAAAVEKSLLEAAQEREKGLLNEITELQRRLICAQEEIQKLKTENAQVRTE